MSNANAPQAVIGFYHTLTWGEWVHVVFTGRVKVDVKIDDMRAMIAEVDRMSASLQAVIDK